jgi:hypothetical protein
MMKVFGLRSGGILLEKATITSIMDGAEKLYGGSYQQIILYLKVCFDTIIVCFCNTGIGLSPQF